MDITFRLATIEDLPDIVRMLADDFLGKQRERLEDPLPEGYLKAFRELRFQRFSACAVPGFLAQVQPGEEFPGNGGETDSRLFRF